MPAPEIEFTVTVTLVPLDEETDAIVPAADPVVVSEKSSVVILEAASVKATVNVTLVALPAGDPTSVIELICGACASLVVVLVAALPALPAGSVSVTDRVSVPSGKPDTSMPVI